GDVLEPIGEHRKMDVSVDESKDVRGTCAEAPRNLGLVARVPLTHAAEEGRLVAAVVEEVAVRKTCRQVEKPSPDDLLLVALVRPERVLGDLPVSDDERADEVVRRSVGVALDIKEDGRLRGVSRR